MTLLPSSERTRPGERTAEADVRAAIARGIAFLEARQLPSGEVPVFTAKGRLMGGSCTADSSVFPTALAAHSLSFAPGAAGVREKALDFLLAEMVDGGFWKHWARAHPYYDLLPPDLDDTSVASAALAQAGRPFPDQRGQLLANRNGRGLFRTWRLTAAELRHPIALCTFFSRTSARPFDVDAVVNANVLSYLGPCAATRPVVEHLLLILDEGRESQCDKWYENPFAVWYAFSRALHEVAFGAGEIVRRRIATTGPATALDLALALCCQRYWGDVPGDDEIGALLNAQLESGGWPRAGLYHGGRTRLRGNAFAAPHPDTPWWGSEELTTAFCIEALSRQVGEARE